MEVEVTKVKGVSSQEVAVFKKVKKLLKEERISELVLTCSSLEGGRTRKSEVSSVAESVEHDVFKRCVIEREGGGLKEVRWGGGGSFYTMASSASREDQGKDFC